MWSHEWLYMCTCTHIHLLMLSLMLFKWFYGRFPHTVPFLSRLLPSDVCKVHKCGSKIRMDCTLMDFNEMSWQRGDLSFVFNGENQHSGKIFCMWLKVTVFNTLTFMYIFLHPVFCEYKVLLVFKFNSSSVLLSSIHYPLSAEELLCVFIHWFYMHH